MNVQQLTSLLATALMLQSSLPAQQGKRGPEVAQREQPRRSAPRRNPVVRQPVAAQVAARPLGEASTLLPDGTTLRTGGVTAFGVSADTSVEGVKLLHPRAYHTATVLPDGRVFLFGGTGANGLAEEAEIYDPTTKRIEAVAKMEARAHHAAALLTDGRVLIAGGVDVSGELVKRLEVWDPISGTMETLGGEMARPVRGEHGRLLANGNVQVGTEEIGPAREPWSGDELAVAGAIPYDGAQQAPVDRPLGVRFTRAVRVSTVNASTVVLRQGDRVVPAKVVGAEGGMLAFATPEEKLESGTDYQLRLEGVMDGNGVALAPMEIRFRTALPEAETTAGGAGQALGPVNPSTGQREQLPPPALQGPAGVTALYGHVRTIEGRYLSDVTMTLDCGGQLRSGRTDALGRFLLLNTPAGHCELEIDGTTANERGRSYGRYFPGVDLLAGRTNVLPYTIWMTPIDRSQEVTIPSPTTRETVITHPKLKGLELRLPAQTVIRDYRGQVLTRLGITPIPINRPPFPLPKGVPVPIYFTIQPGGAFVEVGGSRYAPGRGAQLVYPNTHRAPAGRVFSFWDYDPDGRGWYVYGRGRVSANRKSIVPDAGVVIYRFSGAMVADWYFAPPLGPSLDAMFTMLTHSVDVFQSVAKWMEYMPDLLDVAASMIRPLPDPVDPSSGLFVYEHLDLNVADVLPLSLQRTYRQGDHLVRSFGVGASHPYDTFLVGDTSGYREADLVLASGSRIHYIRTSPGTAFTDAVFEHSGTQTIFHKSKLSWNGDGWDLKLKDGAKFVFPEAAFAGAATLGAVKSISDRFGNTIVMTRDPGTGLLQRVTSPNGRWISFTYDAERRITQSRDNSGRNCAYEYDEGGRLVKMTDPIGGITEYTYDANDQMLTIKDPRGIVFLTNVYDDDGRVYRQIAADGGTFQFTYAEDANGNLTQVDVSNPRGHVARYVFSAEGYHTGGVVNSVVLGVGAAEQQTYTFERASGGSFVSAIVDPLNRRTQFTYDSQGNNTTVTRLAGTGNQTVTSYGYEPLRSQRISVTDPLMHTMLLGRDALGRLISVTDANGSVTSFGYNTAGQMISVSHPLIGTAQMEYTSGLLTAVTDSGGRRTSRQVDALGRTLMITNPAGNTFRHEYDNGNRPTKVIDAQGAATQFQWDGNSNLLSVTDARNSVTSYLYNNMNQLQTRTDPLVGKDDYVYDFNGNVTSATDRKRQVTGATYDALDRPKVVTFQDGSTITYTYDAGNRTTQIVDSIAGTITRSYDGHDRLLSETRPQGTVSYTYDAAGRRATMTVVGQAVVNYTYDNANRLLQIQQGSAIVAFGYDAANRVTSVTLPNGVMRSFSFDASTRLSEVTYSRFGVPMGNLTYAYDPAGRVMAMGGSLARINLPAAVSGLAYNAANQLQQWGGQAVTHDANGNMTGEGGRTYVWNARDELASVSGPGVAAAFAYDSMGSRVSRTVSGATTGYVFDGANVVQELTGGSPSANLLTGLVVDQVFARTDSGGTSSFLVDGLNSTIGLADGAGVVQTQYTYEAFGAATASGSGSGNKYQFTGRENDGTGLLYYRARYYHPGMQRFISQDPLGMGGGDLNLYGYVGNGPTNRRDPSGMIWASMMALESVMGPVVFNGAVEATLLTLAAMQLQIVIQTKMQMSDPSGGTRGGGQGNPGDESVVDEILTHIARDHPDRFRNLSTLRDRIMRVVRDDRLSPLVAPDNPRRKLWVSREEKLIVLFNGEGGGTALPLNEKSLASAFEWFGERIP